MIIIEGPDNSGKTTLGQMLSRELMTPVVHSMKPDPTWSELQALDQAIMQLLPQQYIRDRTYAISEWVYGPICRGRSALGALHKQALNVLLHQRHLIIYCRPKDEVILKNDGREQMEGVLENHLAIVKGYDRLMDAIKVSMSIEVIEYDWTEGDKSFFNLVRCCRQHLTDYKRYTKIIGAL